MIDRINAPAVHEIGTVDYLKPLKWELQNGLKIWELNAGSQELVKLDFVFKAGTYYQNRNLVAGLSNAFMNQGSENYTAQEIAEAFDSRGAYLQLIADQHFGSVSILSLNKHLDEILKVTADVLIRPTYPEAEFKTHIEKKKQQFTVENSKVKTLAQKQFSKVLFGPSHGYSNTNKIEDYNQLDTQSLKEFHLAYYRPSNCNLIVAGKIETQLRSLLERYFRAEQWSDGGLPDKMNLIKTSPKRTFFTAKKDAVQSAIRMGRLVPNRTEDVFHGLNVMTTILGGYFGSRLMMNLRERNGYTYGIGAYIYSLPEAAYLSISTEVGVELVEKALTEIYFEIERLQNDLVPLEELEVVRNYLMGENLRSFDGIFAMSNSLRTLIESDLDYTHYDRFVDVVNSITPYELREIAQLYYCKADLKEVIAGERI